MQKFSFYFIAPPTFGWCPVTSVALATALVTPLRFSHRFEAPRCYEQRSIKRIKKYAKQKLKVITTSMLYNCPVGLDVFFEALISE